MNWVKKALSICSPQVGLFYTSIEPPQFYEWRFRKMVPKGAKFTAKLPRTDVCTRGQVIVSAKLPESSLHKDASEYQVTDNVKTEVMLTAGEISSPVELYSKYVSLRRNLDRNLGMFRESAESQAYFISTDREPHLFRIVDITESAVDVQTFGTVTNVRKKLSETFGKLKEATYTKKRRAYEMETFRRYENYLTVLNNPQVPIDAAKMKFLLTTASIKPLQTRTSSWEGFYLELTPEAQSVKDQINAFDSLSWVKYTSQYLSPE